MSLLSIPVFTLQPDWSDKITESLEWKTAILASARTGANGTSAEQRRQLRLSPRRTVDLNLILEGTDRTYFDLLIHAAGATQFYVPLFHNVDLIYSPISAGATFIPTKDRYSEIPTVSGPCILTGQDRNSFELFEGFFTSSDDPTMNGVTVTTAGGLVKGWPKGSRLYPAAAYWLPQQPQFNSVTDRVTTCTVRFTSNGPQDRTSTGLEGFDSFSGTPVLIMRPNRKDDLPGTFYRNVTTVDGGTGLWNQVDIGGRGFGTQTHTWFAHGRKEHAAVLDMLYMLRGRALGFWCPTFNSDLEMISARTGAATSIAVAGVGYAALGFPVEGRSEICMFMRDGTRLFFTITDAATDANGNDILGLNAPLGRPISPADIDRISFMAYSRFDQDVIEIAHQTDNKGVSTISAVIRQISNDRDGPDWNPVALASPTMLSGACGFVPAAFFTTNNPAHSACSALQVYGFSWMSDSEIAPISGASNTLTIDQTYSTNGDYRMEATFPNVTLTGQSDLSRGYGVAKGYRTPDRLHAQWHVYWGVDLQINTNHISIATATMLIFANIGGETIQQGCDSFPDFPLTPYGSRFVVSATYVFGEVILGVGMYPTGNLEADFQDSFPTLTPVPDIPETYHFDCHLDGDPAGRVTLRVDSRKHGTSIIHTLDWALAANIANFALYTAASATDRSEDTTKALYPVIVEFSDITVTV